MKEAASGGMAKVIARAIKEGALEWLETIDNPKVAWQLLHSIGADIDDPEVLFHLGCNPNLTYVDLELYQVEEE